MAAYHYEFDIKGLYKVDAQIVGEMFDNMSSSGIEITPQSVLDAGRDVSSPIHDVFEWEDSVAAEQYRLDQARRLIGHVRIVREEEPPQQYKERGFVSISNSNNVYVPLANALSNEEYRNHLLKQAKSDCEVFQAKYRRLQELSAVISAMNEFTENVG
jgi:hypothetical protein